MHFMPEIFDYRPQLDTYLKPPCFPTFSGHCGCVLFNVQDFSAAHTLTDSEKAMLTYLNFPLGRNNQNICKTVCLYLTTDGHFLCK